eukprot:m.3393 g.3393  ORF g.3393 m.3393 type:complete len:428 (-) comp2762_c0_seq2:75-1358(-)
MTAVVGLDMIVSNGVNIEVKGSSAVNDTILEMNKKPNTTPTNDGKVRKAPSLGLSQFFLLLGLAILTMLLTQFSFLGNKNAFIKPYYLAPENICRIRNWSERVRTPFYSKVYESKGCTEMPSISAPVGRCKLALIAAGMPRTGSTVTLRMLQKAGKILGLPNFTPLRYWNMHLRNTYIRRISNCSEMVDERNRQNEIINNLTADSIVVIKSHEFDETLLRLCKKHIVFLSTRDMGDVALSKYKLGWYTRSDSSLFDGMNTTEMVQYLASTMYGDIQEHECWKRESARNVNVQYDEIKGHCAFYMLRIVGAIAQALDRNESYIKHFNKRMDMVNIDDDCETHDLNPWQASTSKEFNSTQEETRANHSHGLLRKHELNHQDTTPKPSSSLSPSPLTDEVLDGLRYELREWQQMYGRSPGVPIPSDDIPE